MQRLLRRRVVFFECQQPRDWEFLQPIFDALVTHRRVAAYVLTNDRGAAYGVLYRVSPCRETLAAAGVPPAQIAANLGPFVGLGDAYLAATAWDTFMPMRRSIPRIHVPHGLVNKVDQYGAAMAGFDVLLSTGPLCSELASASLTRGGVAYEIAEVGYPKLDLLFHELARRRPGSDAPAGAAPARVLFAPTWGRGAALDRWGLAPVGALLDAGYRVTIKLHPMSLAGVGNTLASGGVDWCSELERFEGDERVAIAGGGPGALVDSDVMVSDASGIAYEFMLMGKPVVFLDVPDYFTDAADPLASGRRDDLSDWGRRYGIVVSGPEGLADGVRAALREADAMAVRARELRARLVVNAGVAGEAAAAWLRRRLGIDDPAPTTGDGGR